ncbi:hypothetical protein FDG92_gp56 [Arthrobacter phage Jasmine]|uniref:Uncharacterized protein n=1 Tax=Arthrobacter phage Jasmine TaxID=1772302 RepID=A0A0U4B3N4_9CAUD|nr:hypothetical protein FDG92_gp56 [Arthrobacter phage Jasmine]ALY09326.1 hypothetical protein JASMINE_57 [Arthrobacter phage Jasmine]
MTRTFQGASTGSAGGFFGHVSANYTNDKGYIEVDKYIAIRTQPNSSNEVHYAIYKLGKYAADPTGFTVSVNHSAYTAYIDHNDVDIPEKLAERFVNMVTGKKVLKVEKTSVNTSDWFEVEFSEEDYVY